MSFSVKLFSVFTHINFVYEITSNVFVDDAHIGDKFPDLVILWPMAC